MAMGFMPFGLLFDLFDGKVARWRGKSSLMGQELDSLADLASYRTHPQKASVNTSQGILRRRSRRPCLCYGLPHHSRPDDPYILRLMRSDSTSTIQRHSRNVAKGRIRKIEILRGNPDPLRLLDDPHDGGYNDKRWMDTREYSFRRFDGRNTARGASLHRSVSADGLSDGQQDDPCAKAVRSFTTATGMRRLKDE
jgi:hypothetical protein